MYGLLDYGKMMADTPRRRAYEQALREVITPGCRVVDLGCGLGIFTLLACRLGAGHVDAIDPNASLEVARQVIRDNGFADRVHFFAGRSQDFQPTAPADVLIADLRGVLPMAGHHLPAIDDARRRLLRPGGAMIPRRDTLWSTVVEAPELYVSQVEPWADGALDFDYAAVRRLTVNGWCKGRVGSEHWVTPAVRWGEIDYADCADPDVRGAFECLAHRRAVAHGLLVWFDGELTSDVALSNAPDQPELIYGSAFFPFTQPLAMDAGDRLQCAFDAVLMGEEYVWTWASRQLRDGEEMASFRQSTFFSEILVPERLARQSADFRPRLDGEGAVDAFVMGLMDGERSLAEISQQLLQAYPNRFSDPVVALQRVAELSRRYG